MVSFPVVFWCTTPICFHPLVLTYIHVFGGFVVVHVHHWRGWAGWPSLLLTLLQQPIKLLVNALSSSFQGSSVHPIHVKSGIFVFRTDWLEVILLLFIEQKKTCNIYQLQRQQTQNKMIPFHTIL